MLIHCKVCGFAFQVPLMLGDQLKSPECGKDLLAGVLASRVKTLLGVILDTLIKVHYMNKG